MPTIQHYREQKESAYKGILEYRDKINADDYTPNAEDDANWERCNSDYDAASAEIAKREKILALEQRQQEERAEFEKRTGERKNLPGEHRNGDELPKLDDAIVAWFKTSQGYEPSERELAASAHFRMNPHANWLSLPAAERRDMASHSDTAGGYLTYSTFRSNIEKALLWFGAVESVATVISTSDGNPLKMPTVNDTGNSGALIGENEQVTELDAAVGQVTLYSHKITSRMVQVPYELIRDSNPSVMALLGDLLGERIARRKNTLLTTGTGGNNQPEGIVTGAVASSVTFASATSPTMDELINLIHSVNKAYRPNARWMASDTFVREVRKLKTGTGEYLWQSGNRLEGQAGAMEPDRLLGYGFVVNNDMAVPASGARSVLFGDFSKYVVRNVGGVRFRRLTERFAEFDQDAILGFTECDAHVLDAGGSPIQFATHT